MTAGDVSESVSQFPKKDLKCWAMGGFPSPEVAIVKIPLREANITCIYVRSFI